MKIATLLSLLLLTNWVLGQKIVTSPDKKISMTFEVSNDTSKCLIFSISLGDKKIVAESNFELTFKDMPSFRNNLKIASHEINTVDENWERTWGKSKVVKNNYNELIINVIETNGPKRQINLIARAYNDGVAFRYQIPKQNGLDSIFIKDENTTFKFTENYKILATKWQRFKSAQESEFDTLTLNSLSKNDIIGTPLLVDFNDSWGAILEANLTDWAGMFLTADNDSSTTVKTKLAPYPGKEKTAIATQAPRYSPWRVMILGNKPGDLIESNILHNLSEPLAIADPTWIVPGRSAWDWWWSGSYAPKADFKVGSNTKTMQYYIDFAAEMGWEYQLVDWQWYGEPFEVKFSKANPKVDITKSTDQIDIPFLVKYAKERNVKLLIWLHWWHVNNQLDDAFALYEKWGVAGVKIDFMDRNDQEMVNYYHRVIKKAAEHKLTVDFHGATMPTGLDRTYPNFLTCEGVMGNEYNKWSTRVTPNHCLTLPFTRMLGGQMDFTPGGFKHATLSNFKAVGGNNPAPMVRGTRCFQLAMPVVYESALTVFCDSPDNYRGQEGLEFYKWVPTTWDETKVIDGYPGKYIAVARRSNNDWFIGCMTNEVERELSIPLTFLGEGSYKAVIFKDTPESNTNPYKLEKQIKIVTNSDTLTLHLAVAGGSAIHIKKVE